MTITYDVARAWLTGRILLGSLLLALSLGSCSGGDSGNLGPDMPSNPRLERQAIEQILLLYRTAMLQEDIDRLQEVLHVGSLSVQAGDLLRQEVQRQETAQGFVEAQTFLDNVSTAFRRRTLTALTQAEVDIAADRRSVSFLEGNSAINPTTLEQQTHLMRTTWQLTEDEMAGVVTVRIGAVRQTPMVTVTMPGQVQAGALTRLTVTGTGEAFVPSGVEIEEPETGLRQALEAQRGSFHGLFIPPVQPHPQPLRIHVKGRQGEVLTFSHHYQLRVVGEGVVHRLAGTGNARFFAVAVGPDGTIWGGGAEAPRGGGTLYQVPPGALTARLVGDLLENPAGRVEDLAFDQLGRLHAVVFAAESGVLPADNRDIVLDRGTFCSTVNVFDPSQNYPLLVRSLRTGNTVPSPSTRTVAAGGGDVWLFGSDGGVARVTDSFQDSRCPTGGVALRYDPVFRRETSGLLTNSVPALGVGADGALWFGTALGLTRWHDGQFTPIPFNRNLVVPRNVATLEGLFQALAEAIFAARPLTSVAIGNVSFLEAFGRALVKEDLIFSVTEDVQRRLWAGTLGGGLRRIEAHGGAFRDALHLTRAEIVRVAPDTGARTVVSRPGLGGNVVFSVAVEPDGTVWVATEEGVSRIQERAGTVVTTNFSALDGLALPVRDVAIDALGTAWLATDGGLFRIVPTGGRVQGMVRDANGRAVAAADVFVQGTPIRTVTDTDGRFTLSNLPLGPQTLRFDGTLATGGPFAATFLQTEGADTAQPLTVVMVPLAPRVPVNPVQGGSLTFANAPGVRLDVPPQAVQFPPDEATELGVTQLTLDNLPLPLPAEFTAVAAVDIQPSGTTFITPARLTLPNTAQLPPGRLLVLLRFNETVPAYEEVGHARVSDDGTVITTISGGLTHLSAVVFASTASIAQATLVAVVGDGQRGNVGEPLPQPLVVAVRDGAGHSVSGVPVTFTVTVGQGTITPITAFTDAQGQATAVLTLGPQLGESQVTVTAPGVLDSPVRFSVTAQATLVVVVGDGQRGNVGEPLPQPLVVAVRGNTGQGVAGVPVTFTVTTGQGAVTPTTSRTDALGQATAVLTLGLQLGEYEVTVTATGALGSPIRFTATGGAGPAARLVRVAGDAQMTGVGMPLPQPLVVAATDAHGTPIADLPITFAITAGQGSLQTPQPVRTDIQGQAMARLMLGPQAGSHVVTVTAPGLNAVTFTATGLPAPAARLTVQGPGRAVVTTSIPLLVQLLDAFDNPVAMAGVPIRLRLLTGASSLSPTTTTTNGSGQATFILTAGTSAGTNRLEASAPGLGTAVFSVTVVVDRSRPRLIEVSGNNQVGSPGAELPEPLVVRLEDQFGNPLVGAEVTATVIRGAAEFLSAATLATEAPGAAALRRLVSAEEAKAGVLQTQAQLLSPVVAVTNAQGNAVFRMRPLDMQDFFVQITAAQTDPIQFRISLGPVLGIVGYHIAVDAEGTFLVVDPIQTSVRRLDPRTGESTLVSGFRDDARSELRGTGIMFAAPLGMAVEVDRSLVVADLFQGVIRINPATGDRSPVSGCGDDFCSFIMGQGPPGFPTFQDVAVETSGTLVVVDAFLGVLRIDPTTGDRTPVSGCIDDLCSDTRGSGPLLVLDLDIPSRLITEPDGFLIVIDVGMRAVVRVNPDTGERTIVSSDTVGTGRSFVSPRGIAREAQGTFVVADIVNAGTVVRVNPVTGDRTIVSGSLDEQNCLFSTALAGSGPCFDMPDAIVVAADRSLLIVDAFLAGGAVVRVDPVSGNRRIVSFLRE